MGKFWSSRVAFSIVSTSGNTHNQSFAGRLEMTGEGKDNRFIAKSDLLYGRSSGNETSNSVSSEFRYERTISERLFVVAGTYFERNKFSGYDYRLSGGPGIGYDIVKTQDRKLNTSISLLYHFDDFAQGLIDSTSYAAARADISYAWSIAKNLTLRNTSDCYVSLEDGEKYFFNTNTNLDVRINNHLSMGLNYVTNYQNLLPADIIERLDTRLFTSLIIDF